MTVCWNGFFPFLAQPDRQSFLNRAFCSNWHSNSRPRAIPRFALFFQSIPHAEDEANPFRHAPHHALPPPKPIVLLILPIYRRLT